MAGRHRTAAKCRSKTRRCNSFSCEGDAWIVARKLQPRTRLLIRPYLCPACGRWHVGKANQVERWRAANARAGGEAGEEPS